MISFKPKKISITKYLEKNYGGKWNYDRSISWWICDDGKRHAHYVSNNFNNEYYQDEFANPPSLYLYGDGKPKLLWF